MHESSDDSYATYLRRCARDESGRPPLAPEEFELLARRLEDLHLLGLERHLTHEERSQLIELSCLLLEDLEESEPEASWLADPMFDDIDSRPFLTRNRREIWRSQRRRKR